MLAKMPVACFRFGIPNFKLNKAIIDRKMDISEAGRHQV
jgi:NADPH-dependent glutamate synthase beta subunit-like oxidoreductase